MGEEPNNKRKGQAGRQPSVQTVERRREEGVVRSGHPIEKKYLASPHQRPTDPQGKDQTKNQCGEVGMRHPQRYLF